MTNDVIEKFVEKKSHKDNLVAIHFKERSTVKGLFIQLNDYKELKAKNLWRIVSSMNVDEWRKTKDANLTRIFNGISFTRLTEEQ